ncbi:MAG: hypothetical protein IPJ34_06965 [Myxococcales bacterium]|nr:hypothetical protein [Myxococcales bacterium]
MRGAFLLATLAVATVAHAEAPPSDAAVSSAPTRDRPAVIAVVSSKRLPRALTLRQNGVEREDRDFVGRPLGVGVGVQFVYRRLDAETAIVGDVVLAAEYLPGPGGALLSVAHAAVLSRSVRPWSFVAGPRLAIVVDTSSATLPNLELGARLGVGLGPFEIAWVPAWIVPLHHETRPVFGGEVRGGAASAPMWLSFQARLAF